MPKTIMVPAGEIDVMGDLSASILVETDGTKTADAIDRRVLTTGAGIDGRTVLAAASLFEGIDPSGATGSAAGLRAAFQKAPHGGRVVIPPGEYLIDQNIVVNLGPDGKYRSLAVEAEGARFVLGADATMFTVRGQFDPTLGVSAVAVVDLSEWSGEFKRGLRLTTTTPSGYRRGDIVKLVADDLIAGGRPGSNGSESRIGQFFEVFDVSGATLTLAGTVLQPFTTNVRVARLPQTSFSWRGGEFDVTDAALSATAPFSGSIFGLVRLTNPSVENIVVRRNAAVLINTVSCYRYAIRNVEYRYARNDPTPTGGRPPRFGYGILDNSSSHGRVENLVARMVRHAYSDDTNRIPADSADLTYYGQTFDARVSNSSADTTSSTAWDTHHHSVGTQFVNVIARNTQAAVGLRGRGHRVSGLTTYDCTYNVNVFTETGGGESHSHTIDDVLGFGTLVAGIRLYNNPAGHPNAGVRETRPVWVSRHRMVDSTARLYDVLNGTLHLDHAEAIFAPTLPAGHAGATMNNAEVIESEVVLDYSKVTSTGTGLAFQRHDLLPSIHRSRGLRQLGVIPNVLRAVESLEMSVLQIEGAVYQTTPTAYGQDCAAGSWFDYKNGTVTSAAIALVGAAIASDAGDILRIGRSTTPVLMLELVATTAYTLGKLPPGQHRGQMLTITSRNTSTAAVSVISGASARGVTTAGGTTKAIQPGQTLMLQWSAETGAWRQAQLLA